jgi:hypothetical protein
MCDIGPLRRLITIIPETDPADMPEVLPEVSPLPEAVPA